MFSTLFARHRSPKQPIRRPPLAVEALEDRFLLSATALPVEFAVVNDWGSGFQGQLTVRNTQATPVRDWRLEFDYGRDLYQIWNASLVSHQGAHYVVQNVGWNKDIAPGASVSFGFLGRPGNVTDAPANYQLNGAPVGGPAPLPTLGIADVTAAEGASGDTPLVFTVTLSAASTQPVTVRYQTADGSAQAGSDYTATSGTLTFAAGETQQQVRVNVQGDTVVESDESFLVELFSASGATIADDRGMGVIRNDDTAPVVPALAVSDVTVREGTNTSTPAAFTVSLSQAATGPITVYYGTADGSAVAGSDYRPENGMLTFAAGETRKTVTVQVVGDAVPESNELFLLELWSPTGATLADGRGEATVTDDDTPQAPAFNYGEALQKAILFYEAQRSGALPDTMRLNWRGDSALGDGADVGLDLTGGYYDAGDHVKFGLPMTSSMTLLAWGLLQYPDAYASSGQAAYARDALRWGLDWIVKAHPSPNEFYGQVGLGGVDHSFWGAPELMQMQRPAFKIDPAHPGSDLAGEAAAALAAGALAFRATDPAYASLLLQHAVQLYTFADTYRGKYSDSIRDAAGFYNSYSGYQDELVWGALWLYRATGDAAYLTKAEAYYSQGLAGRTMTWTHSWDDKGYGAAVLLAQLTGKAQYRTDVERWLDYWTVGINGGSTRIRYTPGGLAWLDTWGSLRYAANTAFLAFIYSDTVNDYNGRYHHFAARQINYMLGDNPNRRSYMVGFGNNPPINPHHRGASGVWDGNVDNPTPNRHILYGALVGGPESTDDNNYQDVRGDYISNEVALDYNAAFTGALARMFQEYGGQPLASLPVETPTDEFFVEAGINQQGTRYTEIRGLLNNRSAWPARLSSALSFRYFVDLSELYVAGYTVSDVVVQSNYSQGATVSGVQPWDAARHLYYVDVSFAGVAIGPGSGSSFRKEAQVRIGIRDTLPASAWDPTNDWSYQGLPGNRAVAPTPYIPVYEHGRDLLHGQLPGQPGTPTLSIDNLTVTEGTAGSTTATLTVRLSAALTTPVTVRYATADGTAQAGSDYTATSGTLTFAPGVTSQTLTVTILADALAEGDEAFTVSLSEAAGAALGRRQATVTVRDDDAPPVTTGAQFTVKDNWGSGFVAEMVLTNGGTRDITDWTLEFDLAADIVNIWNAEVVSRTGNHYVIRGASWNGTIRAGGSVSFGFQGAGTVGQGPTNIRLNGTPVG